MRDELRIRVSPEMRKLLDQTQDEFKDRGVNISRVEASRIVARRANKSTKPKVLIRGFDLKI